MNSTFESSKKNLMVFGHPNHELAVYGILQNISPKTIVLTDGGGQERVEQSRNGFRAIGVLDDVTFFDNTEGDFYRALLDNNSSYFLKIVDALAAEFKAFKPDQIFCDGVEYYNPVHDVTLPLVRAAVVRADLEGVKIFEVPLVFQTESEDEQYVFQRLPEVLSEQEIRYELSEDEFAKKVGATELCYTILEDQIGPLRKSVGNDYFKVEVVREVVRPREELPKLEGRRLRYEWRAKQLKEEGVINEEITFERNFVPFFQALLA